MLGDGVLCASCWVLDTGCWVLHAQLLIQQVSLGAGSWAQGDIGPEPDDVCCYAYQEFRWAVCWGAVSWILGAGCWVAVFFVLGDGSLVLGVTGKPLCSILR